jgi:hypothetical protein
VTNIHNFYGEGFILLTVSEVQPMFPWPCALGQKHHGGGSVCGRGGCWPQGI